MKDETIKEQEKQEAIKELKNLFKKCKGVVYSKTSHISRSGMLRHIDFYVIVDNQPINIGWYIEKLGTYKTANDSKALKVSGCGVDMGFSVVYGVSRQVYQGEFICEGKGCRSNDHTNGDRNYKKHKHSDSGYKLKQRWL